MSKMTNRQPAMAVTNVMANAKLLSAIFSTRLARIEIERVEPIKAAQGRGHYVRFGS
jgi:hypothetical protein